MPAWPFWTLFFVACVAAVLLGKILDQRDRRIHAAVPDEPRPRSKTAETSLDSERNT